MRKHHNTLYITNPDVYVGKQGEAVEVRSKEKGNVRIPMHHLASVVCFGPVGISPYLVASLAEQGIAVSFLSEQGKFLARMVGPQTGNILLRRDQYRAADDDNRALDLAKRWITAKIQAARHVLMQRIRNAQQSQKSDHRITLQEAVRQLKMYAGDMANCEQMDQIRGVEGSAAKAYFGVFNALLNDHPTFHWQGRNMRPPRDPINAVLSFLYTLLAHDCSAACQAVGLDPQAGFLHVDRPGRPALALDLMEPLRILIADRLALTLINRNQLDQDDFETQASSAVFLNDEGRRKVIRAYQERKRESLTHPVLGEKTEWGLIPHIEARLLARHLRGEYDTYSPLSGL